MSDETDALLTMCRKWMPPIWAKKVEALAARLAAAERRTEEAEREATAAVRTMEEEAHRAEAAEARLRECEEALRGLRYPEKSDAENGGLARFCDHAAEPCDKCERARRALRSHGDHTEDGT